MPLDSPLLPPPDNAFSQQLIREAISRGFIAVLGQALAYVLIDFTDIESYLSRLSASRRKDLRRKLKKRNLLTIEVVDFGDELFYNDNFMEEAYSMYLEVFRQSEIQFDLLSKEFFSTLLQDKSINGVVFLYRDKDNLVGYNVCLRHNSMLIDKYIGFKYPQAKKLNLYFISWIVNLEYALQNNLSAYIAGWTDPEVKASLGASFTFTEHLVWIKNPVLRAFLSMIKKHFESDRHLLNKK